MFGFLCLLAGVESSTKLAAICRTHNGFSFGCIVNDTWYVLVRMEPVCLTGLTDHMSLQLPEVEAVRAIVLAAARDAGLNQFRLRDRSVKEDGTVVTQTDHRVQAFISREYKRTGHSSHLWAKKWSTGSRRELLVATAPVSGRWIHLTVPPISA